VTTIGLLSVGNRHDFGMAGNVAVSRDTVRGLRNDLTVTHDYSTKRIGKAKSNVGMHLRERLRWHCGSAADYYTGELQAPIPALFG
jgi:hypothetical protein